MGRPKKTKKSESISVGPKSKRGRGRPSTGGRKPQLSFRLASAADMELVERALVASGQSVAEFCRGAIVRHARRILSPPRGQLRTTENG